MTPKKKISLKNVLSMALFLLLLGLLSVYVWQNREDMLQMLRLSPLTTVIMLLLGLGGGIINCFYHLAILRTYHIPLSLTDWMGVVSVSNAIAYVLPLRADLVFSAAYYKRVKGLAYTKSVSMAAGNILFGVGFSLLQILLSLLCMGFIEGVWPGLLWGLWLLGSLILSLFVFCALTLKGRLPGFLAKFNLLQKVLEGFTDLLRSRTLLLQVLCCLILNNLCQLFLYSLCFSAVGLPIPLYTALFYNSVSWLIGIVAIVPGNIGIKESVLGTATLLLGSVFQTGVAVSLLQRAVMLIVHLLMGVVFSFPVYTRFTHSSKAPSKNS